MAGLEGELAKSSRLVWARLPIVQGHLREVTAALPSEVPDLAEDADAEDGAVEDDPAPLDLDATAPAASKKAAAAVAAVASDDAQLDEAIRELDQSIAAVKAACPPGTVLLLMSAGDSAPAHRLHRIKNTRKSQWREAHDQLLIAAVSKARGGLLFISTS